MRFFLLERSLPGPRNTDASLDDVLQAEGYSHVDRLGSRPSALLRAERIQKTICTGLDFFGMLPEAYTYRDLIDKVRIRP